MKRYGGSWDQPNRNLRCIELSLKNPSKIQWAPSQTKGEYLSERMEKLWTKEKGLTKA